MLVVEFVGVSLTSPYTLQGVSLRDPSEDLAIIFQNVTLSELLLDGVFTGVTLSLAPPISPVEGYLSFPNILSGHFADYLMEIYYHIVDGRSYGVVVDPESTRVNRLISRYVFRVVFSDGSEIVEETFYQFLYSFVQAVAAGKRLKGSTDVERQMSLTQYLPSTFNPEWLLAVALN